MGDHTSEGRDFTLEFVLKTTAELLTVNTVVIKIFSFKYAPMSNAL